METPVNVPRIIRRLFRAPYDGLRHFGVVDEGALYRCGQPTPAQLRTLIDGHKLRTVIALRGSRDTRDPDAWERAEREVCREKGVDILLGHPVEEIIVDRGHAAGVVAAGKAWRAATVAAGVNPRLLFDRLVPKGAVNQTVERHMGHWACESATFRMNVALSELPKFTVLAKKGDHLTAGIIMAPSLGYMHRAWLDAENNGWSKQPVVEMLIPSTLDSTLTPKGKHVASLFCQHFRHDLGQGRSWDEEREKAADTIIATVDAHAPGFAKSIIGRQIHSPLDLERRFGLIGGDIFHGKMSLDQLFSARPMIGSADYRMPLPGLYLCGSGAHPGGGVTGAPGHNAAQAVLADRKPWSRRKP